MKMKLFKIEAVAVGVYWELDVNCPSYWVGSGVYDRDYPCWQKVSLEVAAPYMELALEVMNYYKSAEYEYEVEDVFALKAECIGEIDWEKPEIVEFEEGRLEEGVWQG